MSAAAANIDSKLMGKRKAQNVTEKTKNGCLGAICSLLPYLYVCGATKLGRSLLLHSHGRGRSRQ